VSRDALREVLLDGLTGAGDATGGGVVRWAKAYTGYERIAGGRLRAYFADGSHTDGDLLIGADGSNSRVRRQYLPELPRLDLGVANIAGRCPLTPEIADQLPAALVDGSVNNVVPPGPGWMFVSTWGAPEGGRAPTWSGRTSPPGTATPRTSNTWPGRACVNWCWTASAAGLPHCAPWSPPAAPPRSRR